MSKEKVRIEDFITLLKEEIVVKEVSFFSDYYLVETEKKRVYLYFPKVERIKSDLRNNIHIDFDLIYNSPKKVLKRLMGIHGKGNKVYARNTVVARVDKRVALDFQEEHHLQIALPGKYRYGLFYQGDLVSIAVFSGGRIMKKISDEHRSFELIRFCHKGDFLVVGGLSKLLKAFAKDFSPQDIMTYSDLDWGKDSSLTQIGFEVVGILEPQRFAIKENKRIALGHLTEKEDYFIDNEGSLKLKIVL